MYGRWSIHVNGHARALVQAPSIYKVTSNELNYVQLLDRKLVQIWNVTFFRNAIENLLSDIIKAKILRKIYAK